jgi:hypothetical protein
MATDIAGLFGITPELYQQQQQQLINAEAQQFAQLDPYQQVTAGSYGAGRQLGRGIVGALGGEDPQLKIISLRNQIGKSIDPNDPESIFGAAQQLMQAGDQQGGMLLAQEARRVQESGATVGLREAQAQKAREYRQATGVSERNRQLIADADVAIKEGRPLSAQQESGLRFQIAQELKPKVFRDTTTGELTTIEPLDIGLAAPNVAKYLGLKVSAGGGGAGGVTTIQTPSSQEQQVSQAEALSELTSRTKDVISVIKETKALISPFTTGYGSMLKVLPLTDAKTLDNNLETIKSNLSLAQLTALKEASKTGASGLGQVTRNEFDALQSTIAKLDPQSKNFASDLDRVLTTYTRLMTQLEGKTARAETRAGIKKPQTQEQLAPDEQAKVNEFLGVAPKPSSFANRNPQIQVPSPTMGQTKKGTKYQQLPD